MKKLLLLCLLLCAPALAHDYWLKPEGGGAALIYGHADESEPYQSRVVRSVTGWAAGGAKREVKKSFVEGQLRLSGKGVSGWSVEVDNGYWSKTVEGWKNVGKRQQPKALKSTRDRHFAKLVSSKSPSLVAGQALEIVLTSATTTKIEGKVLLRGKPAGGLEIEQNHHKVGQTDANGKFSLKPSGQGLVVLGVHLQEKLEGDAEADFLNLDATLAVKF